MPDPKPPDSHTVLPNILPLDVSHIRSLQDIKTVVPAAYIQTYGDAKANFLRQGGDGVEFANDLTAGILGQALDSPDSYKVRDCVAELLAQQLIAQPDLLEAWQEKTVGRALQCLGGGTMVNNLEVQADFSPASKTKAAADIDPDAIAKLADAGFNISTMKTYREKYDRLATKHWLIGRLLADSTLPLDERHRRNSLYVRTLRVAAANGLVDEAIIDEAGAIVKVFVDRMAFNLGDHNFNPGSSEKFLTWAGGVQETIMPFLMTAPADTYFRADPVAKAASNLLAQRIQARLPATPRY